MRESSWAVANDRDVHVDGPVDGAPDDAEERLQILDGCESADRP